MDKNLKNDFKDREAEALKSGDINDLQFLADEIAEAGDFEWAIKLYKKAAKLAKDVVDFIPCLHSWHCLEQLIPIRYPGFGAL